MKHLLADSGASFTLSELTLPGGEKIQEFKLE